MRKIKRELFFLVGILAITLSVVVLLLILWNYSLTRPVKVKITLKPSCSINLSNCSIAKIDNNTYEVLYTGTGLDGFVALKCPEKSNIKRVLINLKCVEGLEFEK
jgi:hypothetical protein